MVSSSFSLACSISTRIVKKVLKTTRNKKKKHNKIVMLARSILNNIESKVSEIIKKVIRILWQLLMKNKKISRIKRKY